MSVACIQKTDTLRHQEENARLSRPHGDVKVLGFAAALLGFGLQLCHLFLSCATLGKFLILSVPWCLDLQSERFDELKDANAFNRVPGT